MSETAKPPSTGAKSKVLKPRDAATLILVDRSRGEPRVLMGRRRMDQVFMPGKFVFPGGSVDKEDRHVESADELSAAETARLLIDMKGTPSEARARALALAAIRETFEEAGIILGVPAGRDVATPHEGWQPFFARGFLPKLSGLRFFARAITPPGRPRRFDTRFFCISAEHIAQRVDPLTDELSGVEWFTREETRSLDLPPITHVILEELGDHLKAADQGDGRPPPVPYYHSRAGTFRRDLLTLPGEGDPS